MKVIESIDFETHDIKWLHDMHKKGLLEIDNSFQRNYVWTQKNQNKLLETILLGFSIPEIYLWNTGTDPDTGDTRYSIIDGQQRSGAIMEFINGNYKLRGLYLDKDSNIFDAIKDKNFQELDSSHKQSIWSYKFSLKIVREQVQKDEIIQMFLRLNSNNYTLNPQELRHAEFNGKFLKLAEKISEFDFWKHHNYFSTADMRRMKDIAFISNLLIFMRFVIDGEITSTGINKAYELYNDEYLEENEDEEVFKNILSEIEKIIDNKEDRINFLKKNVHFYSLFTAIYPFIKDGKQLEPHQIQRYQTFIDNYENDEKLETIFEELYKEIEIYKSKVKEGTNQKSNRLQRLAIIQKLLNHI